MNSILKCNTRKNTTQHKREENDETADRLFSKKFVFRKQLESE